MILKGVYSLAIDAKVSFMNMAEKRLKDEVTANVMTKVMSILSDVMQSFDFRETTEFDGTDDLLSCYIDALRVQGRTEKTIARYKYIITRLVDYLKKPIRQITVYHLRNYITERKNNGVADSTIEGEREVFSAFFNWLQRESLIEKNPTSNLGTVKCAKKEKKIFNEIDIAKLNSGCNTIRDKAIINFLSSTGCRISEMTSLNRDQVRFDSLECVVHGKGNKERIVYMSPVAGMYLKEYLQSRKDNEEPLFLGIRNERLQPGGVREMLNVIARKMGVDHVHPHKFRRTLATELSRKGMQIQEIARILGHDKLDTTMTYVILNNDDVRASYRKYA